MTTISVEDYNYAGVLWGVSMLINLRNLKFQVNDIENFKLQKQLPDKLLEVINGRFLAPCQVDLTVEHTGDLYLAQGRLESGIKTLCARCLSEVSYEIKTEVNFSMVEFAHENKYSREDVDIVFHSDLLVDITPLVLEAILISLPMRVLCHPDCKGLCVKCGINKNIESCDCEKDITDPRWEKLKDLL